MEKIEYELRQQDEQWHLLRDGRLACVTLRRAAAIDSVASFHRQELRQESFSHLNLVGFTVAELRNSDVLDINWRRKGPPIQLARFGDAEYYLTDIRSIQDAPHVFLRYHHALNDNRFSDALDQMIVLGDLVDCPSQYWQILQTIAGFVWSSAHIVPNRKSRGQLQTKIEFIDRRAKGDRCWRPKLAIEDFLNW